jgi:hypothetical protein
MVYLASGGGEGGHAPSKHRDFEHTARLGNRTDSLGNHRLEFRITGLISAITGDSEFVARA